MATMQFIDSMQFMMKTHNQAPYQTKTEDSTSPISSMQHIHDEKTRWLGKLGHQ
jgi:hypothetical protein